MKLNLATPTVNCVAFSVRNVTTKVVTAAAVNAASSVLTSASSPVAVVTPDATSAVTTVVPVKAPQQASMSGIQALAAAAAATQKMNVTPVGTPIRLTSPLPIRGIHFYYYRALACSSNPSRSMSTLSLTLPQSNLALSYFYYFQNYICIWI